MGVVINHRDLPAAVVAEIIEELHNPLRFGINRSDHSDTGFSVDFVLHVDPRWDLEYIESRGGRDNHVSGIQDESGRVGFLAHDDSGFRCFKELLARHDTGEDGLDDSRVFYKP